MDMDRIARVEDDVKEVRKELSETRERVAIVESAHGRFEGMISNNTAISVEARDVSKQTDQKVDALVKNTKSIIEASQRAKTLKWFAGVVLAWVGGVGTVAGAGFGIYQFFSIFK